MIAASNPVMNPFARPLLIALLAALAVSSPVQARRRAPPKKAPPLSKIMTNPSGVLTYASDKRFRGTPDTTISAAHLAEPTDDAETWAGEVGSYVMGERVITYMENKYTAAESFIVGDQVRNFVYFYGFDITSQDLRGSAFYGIDQRQELEMRRNMTNSFKGYMLGKGFIDYLKTIKAARPYVSTVERVERASQLSVEIKSAAPDTNGEVLSPWKIKTGPDLGSRTIFVKADKGPWNFELRNSFGFNELTASAGHVYYRSFYSMKYFNSSKVVTSGYQYHLTRNWWAKASTDLPLTGNNIGARAFHTVGVRHLF